MTLGQDIRVTVTRIGLICVLTLTLQGCFTIPPDVLRELEPPQPAEPNNFPPSDAATTKTWNKAR